jgi:hypothetical protein
MHIFSGEMVDYLEVAVESESRCLSALYGWEYESFIECD